MQTIFLLLHMCWCISDISSAYDDAVKKLYYENSNTTRLADNSRSKKQLMLCWLSCFTVNDATVFDDVADSVLVAAELVNEMLPPTQ